LLAEALSHDLNNQLSVILAQASGLRLAAPPGELPAPALGAIMDAVHRAAGLLRAAAGPHARQAAALQIVDLNSIVPDCAALLAHLAKGRLEVGLELGKEVPAVAGEEDLLRTMIFALGRHMLAILPVGSRLRLRTFRQPSTAAAAPDSAGLSIGDEAPGGVAGRLESLEDTAFSSDAALARAIARVHRGQCGSAGTGSRGMSWEIILPGIAEPGGPRAAPAPLAQAPTIVAPLPLPQPALTPGAQPVRADGKPCKVLLAEDEENFRVFMDWALRERGYEVVSAKDGQEALERFQEAPESFGLAILDSYMPRMGGLEAYLRMQVLRPDMPVLFASGFTRGASVDVLVAGCPGPASVLSKPFSATDLIEAVQKALAPR
jgi:two-component system cell cycle sensor histidine kinase/response regulator CckA